MELNLRGLRCPLPLIRLTAALEELPSGGRCLVEVDDPGFADDLSDWCEATGHRLLRLEQHAGVIRAELEKRASP